MKTTLRNTKRPVAGTRGGFSLIEVTLAVGIIGVCVATMQGLVPIGIKAARIATEETASTTMLAAVATDLRCSASGSNVSSRYGISMPDSGQASSTNLFLMEDGTLASSPTNARFAVAIALSNSPSTTVTSLTTAKIKVYWPPSASIDHAQGSVETLTAFNREMQKGGKYRSKKEYRDKDDDDHHDGEHDESDDDDHHGEHCDNDREGDDD